jgi:hypothetical protein
MTELLIISHYYPPEMGAASNRIYQLANGLKDNFSVTVVTPLPNYPEGRLFPGYRGKIKEQRLEKGITVKRLWIFPSKSKNKFVRLLSMLSYSISLALYFAFHSLPKKVIIQSPPLLVAFTSVFFLRSKHRQLILNVSDLWPDAGLDLGALKKGKLYSLLKKIESFNYRNAQLVLGQSEEILAHVTKITTRPKTLLYRNFPTENLLELSETSGSDPSTLKLVYAGLLGVAQGLLRLCEELNFKGVELHIYGAGPEQAALENFIKGFQ